MSGEESLLKWRFTEVSREESSGKRVDLTTYVHKEANQRRK